LIGVGAEAENKILLIAEKIREAIPSLRLLTNCGGGSFKNQFKKADKSGARVAIILGEEELRSQQVSIKFLREERPQETVAIEQLSAYLVSSL